MSRVKPFFWQQVLLNCMRRLVAPHIVVGPMDDGLEMTNLTTVIQSSNISSNK